MIHESQLQVIECAYTCSASLFASVAHQDWSVYLDSGNLQGHAPRAASERYDIIAADPIATLVTTRDVTTLGVNGASSSYSGDPLLLLQNELADFFPDLEQEKQKAAYLPGAYGYFSYDLSRRFEELPSLAQDRELLPEMAIGLYSVIVVVDHENRKTQLISLQPKSASVTMLGFSTDMLMQQWLSVIDDLNGQKTDSGGMSLQSNQLSENQSREEYRDKFNQIRQYTIEGDCYQVNFAKRFSCEVTGDAWATYCELRAISPAPYGSFMQLPFAQILSNSPESFIRCRDRQITTSPIKGTRPRDHIDAEKDLAIAKELEASEKDRAENLMIVDLMRNDLSRCCELGSVKVPKLFALHSFANVHHLISTVTGVLREGLHGLDLLRSCFPGGSITGAPKIRAMEIIEELEPDRRGLYCGSIGYVGVDGTLETNIAIRTIVVKDGIARFSAGGGLVIDSDSEDEHQELLDKARMMKEALMV